LALSEKGLKTAGGLRGLVEDLLAPNLGRLEVKVEALGGRCDHLASEIQELWQAHRTLLTYVGEQLAAVNSRLGNLEGRSDGLKSELTAVLQLEILKATQKFKPFAGPPLETLLPPSEPASE
jgi:hypothetical protein